MFITNFRRRKTHGKYISEGKENRMERTLILTLSSGISDEPIKEYLLHNAPEYLFG